MTDWLQDFKDSSGEIRLSEYVALNEKTWHDANEQFLRQLFLILGQRVRLDFYNGDLSQDSGELFAKIRGILLDNYQNDLYAVLAELGSSGESFEREFIFGTMLSVVRQRENANALANLMKDRGIIRGFSFVDGRYSFDTVRFGVVNFEPARAKYPRAERIFEARDLSDGCHKYTEEFLKEYQHTTAVTCTQNKMINLRYYHSFILDGDNVVDVANNIILEKSWYYYLTAVAEINAVTFRGYLETRNNSSPYDESGTLFDLLRMAVYKDIKS